MEQSAVERAEKTRGLLTWAVMQGPAYGPLSALVRLRGLMEEVHREAHNAVAALRYVRSLTYYPEDDEVVVHLQRTGVPEHVRFRPRDVRQAEAQPAARQQSLPY